MQGIENSNRPHSAQNHPSENSRRPGTPGHPGRHLGHSKAENASHASAPRFEQQLKSDNAEPKNKSTVTQQNEAEPEQTAAFDIETTAEKVARNGQLQRGNSDTNQKADDKTQDVDSKTFDIQLNHLQDTGDAFAEQIAFTSRTHAISTGLF